MNYTKLEKATFIRRPNRFLALVELDGNEIWCHVKNTGRCRELLVPGARVYVEKSGNPARKTAYSLIGVDKGALRINMDSQAPNKVAWEYVAAGGLGFTPQVLKREQTYGNSRFDLYAEHDGIKCWIEVKGVTLEENGTARFPDAPSARAVKHVEELAAAVTEGYEAWILFVVQMKGVHVFQPNWATHPAFGDALRKAAEAGVRVRAVDCIVNGNSVTADAPVPVDLKDRRV